MEKPSLNMSFVFAILAIFVISVLTYVSMLGENHKIDRVINSYFDKLKDGMYLEACDSFSSDLLKESLTSVEQRLRFNFLLELSLLKQYDLIESYDYKIELKRGNFWIPFISDDSVRVSILLRQKKDTSAMDALPSGRSKKIIRDLIIVGREKRQWKIKRFTIADSSLADIYNDLQQTIDLNKYAKMTPDGFRLKDTKINFETLTPIDKRLLRFSLHKIQRSLDPPGKKGTGPSLTYPSP
jgi:hypothetical protein